MFFESIIFNILPMQRHNLILLSVQSKNVCSGTWYFFWLILYYAIAVKEDTRIIDIIEKLRSTKTLKQQSTHQASFTKNFKRLLTKYGIEYARKTYLNALGFYLLEQPDNSYFQFLYARIKPKVGFYFRYGGDAYYWHDESQIMAETAPLYIPLNRDFIQVSFENCWHKREYWNERGFYASEPIAYRCLFSNFINEPVEVLGIEVKREDLEEYGFAKPKDLILIRDGQWEDGERFFFWRVSRKEKEFGFWQAYKWWAGCESWYEEKHPEWFDVNDEFHEATERIHKEILGNGYRLSLKRNAAVIESFVLRRINGV
jgi:hypothetical protein